MLLAYPAHTAEHWTQACLEPPPSSLAARDPRATVVLIIDDLGHQLRNGMAMVELPGKLNLAVLPHTPHGRHLAEAGYAAGKEIMLHAPMSNHGGIALGQGGLTASLSREEFDHALSAAIEDIPHLRGINNHMGSELTEMPLQMGWVMQQLLMRELYFVDSRTTVNTVAAKTAAQFSVPHLSRTVFLDNERNAEAIGRHFDKLLALAEERGLAVGIGHPYLETSDFLREAIPAMACRGVALALVSEVLQEAEPDGLPPQNRYDPASEPDVDAALGHIGLGLGHAVFPKVKNAGREHRVGAAKRDALNQVVEVPNAT
ncbi:divergent polysaccharide deacetylase family protein [Halioglobus maricola]|uniref:Divergent polysaccharide deacetylase family protein n=1 Tax=Halioglobus maricola TaxID=2601894 RepID=A0A5P9NQ32_9GAMM|nr:divergent polysaccharide deacetylase family protein [Halioglobus maricola]